MLTSTRILIDKDPTSLVGLLEILLETDREFVKRSFNDGHYQVRSRITERGWHYGIGLMSSLILHTKLARICLPSTESAPFISKPLWVWESHENVDAIALLRAYVKAVEKFQELVDAHSAA